MMIKPLLINALETALNQYLSLDEDVGIFLQPLAGKIIAITMQPFAWTFYLCPTAESIQLLEHCADTPDTTITGSVIALGLMGISNTPMNSVFSGEVVIAGDTEIGKKFQELFAKLDIDLEEQVSRFTGDVIAHKFFRYAKMSQEWMTDSLQTFQLNLSEYLQDETRDLPAQPEIDIFYNDVDRMRMDFDRLRARIFRLEKTIQ